jgi:hypothetical protein
LVPWALSVLDGGIVADPDVDPDPVVESVPLLVDGDVVEPEPIGDAEPVDGDVVGDGDVDPAVSVVELLVPEEVCVVGLVAGSVDEVCATAKPMAVTKPVAAAPATQFNFLLM